jgi:predicted nucleotidyltransferase
METNVDHKLNENQQYFFRKFSNYIGETLYFYGSITRFDYIPGKSDIDIAIFTHNLESAIHKICTFLDVPKSKFKKTILKIKNKIVHGLKIAFQNEQEDINIEISIFEAKYKNLVKSECEYKNNKMTTPVILLFYIIKICYYVLGIITFEQYKKVKILFMDDENNFIKVYH